MFFARVCLFVCLFVCLSVCQSVCLSVACFFLMQLEGVLFPAVWDSACWGFSYRLRYICNAHEIAET